MDKAEQLNEGIDWDAEFAADPDYQAMTTKQRERLLSIMEKMPAMGMAAVHGEEDPAEPDADINCGASTARLCRFIYYISRLSAAKLSGISYLACHINLLKQSEPNGSRKSLHAC